MKKFKLLLLLCLVATGLFGQKMLLRKSDRQSTAKKHPYIDKLYEQTPDSQMPGIRNKAKNPNFERLLVILVDFPAELTDDPNTTGNGKFQLEPDPTYLYSIGSPPHNQLYFEKNLEAVKYYYRAVSAESYQLDYDVYPKTMPAYTLPHPMGYYNPVGASSELFVARMEEYFKTAFETADITDPEIDFGSYAHYMIIHAGSDWQHDIFGDTPSDIPSFFIRVSAGKEAVVDGGNTLISNACNVPATISQDFEITDSNGTNIYTGYGALNSVLAHEFGHSLGMVDLYNVANYRPMVGVFDIMDSGGSGILVDSMPDGGLVFIEGALPTFPGAFSRNLVFGDLYKSKGFLKVFPDIALDASLNLNTIAAKQLGPVYTPHTYKIPLNDKEYILVENRNVDPDNDGGTAVYGDLDDRVILYPTPADDPTNPFTYEYDYLLPSFLKDDGTAIGGGILVWLINEDVIYNQGQSYPDGSWVNNFDNNTVNVDITRRGVSVIEADGLIDLGSYYSRYWTGTPFEYFHARKPNLDDNGSFINWSQEPWKPELNAFSNPKLLDSYNVPGFYGLKNISNPAANMSFGLSSGFFSATEVHDLGFSTLNTSAVINSGISDYDIPAFSFAGGLNLFSYQGTSWDNVLGVFPATLGNSFPPQKSDNNNDGFYELVSVVDNQVWFIDFANVEINSRHVTFPAPITTTPLALGNKVYLTTSTHLYSMYNFGVDSFVEFSDCKRIAGMGGEIVLLGQNSLTILDSNTLAHIATSSLPEAFGNLEPLIYASPDNQQVMVYLMSKAGNLYRYIMASGSLERVFSNHSNDKPGQLAISKMGPISPVISFGIGNKLYALKADGSLLHGFPINAAHPVSDWECPMALQLQGRDMIFYPLENKGYIAVDEFARIVPEYTLSFERAAKEDYLFYMASANKLFWYYPDATGKLYIHSLSSLPANPVLFAGFRNGGSGYLQAPFSDEPVSTPDFNMYVYPNPVRGQFYRLHLSNATGSSKLKIYDITGTLVSEKSIPESANNPRDIEISTAKLSSGVYILCLDNNGKTKRLKFAVER